MCPCFGTSAEENGLKPRSRAKSLRHKEKLLLTGGGSCDGPDCFFRMKWRIHANIIARRLV
jgi:hypothetical protein